MRIIDHTQDVMAEIAPIIFTQGLPNILGALGIFLLLSLFFNRFLGFEAVKGKKLYSALAGVVCIVAGLYLAKSAEANAPVPSGSIVAWHSNQSWVEGSKADLPKGWVKCDGGTVADKDSPLYNSTIPNLNGEGRFLRGAKSSGVLQGHAFEAHTHMGSANGTVHTNGVYGHGNVDNWTVHSTGGPVKTRTQHTGGPVSGSHTSETRPVNMSVVWIMRIK